MSKDDQRPIDSLEEEFIEQPDSTATEKNVSEHSEQNADSSRLNLEDIRTAGF